MYRYGEVETALSRIHAVTSPNKAALRARIKYFQRLGIATEAPGKGRRALYGVPELSLLAFCLELAQFGFDPKQIAITCDVSWVQVKPFLVEDNEGEDRIFYAMPLALYHEQLGLKHRSGSVTRMLFGTGDFEAEEFVHRASMISRLELPRAVMINLTPLRERITSALAHAEPYRDAG